MASTITRSTTVTVLFAVALTLLVAAPPPRAVAQLPPVGAPGPSTGMMGAGAPGPTSDDCFTYLYNMSDCLTYVEAGSKIAKPDKGCCPELAGLVDSHPICLCQLLGSPDSVGIQIDIKRATSLPSVCGVQTPPVSLCSVAGYPVSGLSPSEAPSPSDGEAISPTSGRTPSGATGHVASLQSLIVALAVIVLAAAAF